MSTPPLTAQSLQQFVVDQQEIQSGIAEDCAALEDMLVRLAGPALQGVEEDATVIQEIVDKLAEPIVHGTRKDTQQLLRMGRKLVAPIDAGVAEDTTILTGIAARAYGSRFSTNPGSTAHSGVRPPPNQVVPGKPHPSGGHTRPPGLSGPLEVPGFALDSSTGGTARPAGIRPVPRPAVPAGLGYSGGAGLSGPLDVPSPAPATGPSPFAPPTPSSAGQYFLPQLQASTLPVPSTFAPPTPFAPPLPPITPGAAPSPFAPPAPSSAAPNAPAQVRPVSPFAPPAPSSASPQAPAPVSPFAPPLPSSAPPAPSLPIPPLPDPPAPGCDLCEAVTYLAAVVQHCCASMSQAVAQQSPVDWDQPNALVFGEHSADWHATMARYYEGAFDALLYSQTARQRYQFTDAGGHGTGEP
jgi:hypothetical protein